MNTVPNSGESTTPPTVCSYNLYSCEDYIASLQKNILVQIVDVDYVHNKLLHACDNLAAQLQANHVKCAHKWRKLLVRHVNYCHAYFQSLKTQQDACELESHWLHNSEKIQHLLTFIQVDQHQWQQLDQLIRLIYQKRVARLWDQELVLWNQHQLLSDQLGAQIIANLLRNVDLEQ